ncbi:16S rRNA (adenine(1518)-N(6)/adenine(1519)-N(6))-dimethyltransferase RsmA [Candidatus Margulisiibacteriota bacterium]
MKTKKYFQHKKKWDQHFLKDGNMLRKIVSTAGVTQKDDVIEIGCGEGHLTQLLCAHVHHCYIFEIDEEAIICTQERLGDYTHFTCICGDVLKTFPDFLHEHINDRFTLVANIPYSITSPLLTIFTEFSTRFSKIFLTVQKEIAERLTARPNTSSYSGLTVKTSLYFDISYLFSIPAHLFIPPPKVDSAFISLIPKDLKPRDTQLIEKVVNATFWGKRKKLSTSLLHSPYLKLTKKQIAASLASLHLDPALRPQHLSQQQFIDLTSALKDAGLVESQGE